MKRILILDNYDSFTYNLVHAVEAITGVLPDVVRNDQLLISQAADYTHIIVSPGPGLPQSAGILLPLIRHYGPNKKILGVCLGHQAIGLAYGAGLANLPIVKHGISSFATQAVTDEALFQAVPVRFQIGHYHSWVIDPATIPPCIRITAYDTDGNIMAVSHREHAVKGVQFHPESVLTPQGRQILANFLQ